MALGAVRLRGRWLGSWAGAPARLAEVTIGLGLVLGVAQVLGVVGALERGPLVAGCALAGAVAAWAGRAPAAGGGPEPPAPDQSRLGSVIAVAAGALAAMPWTVGTAQAIRHGMLDGDTLNYHAPLAGRFVQDGSIAHLPFVYSDPLDTFVPANAALLHAVGILLLDRDILSPVINMGWFALALLAAWCIGRPFGRAPASVCGAAVVLASPTLIRTQAGSAENDIVCLALLLVTAALLVNARGRTAPTLLAALAAGLAAGTKVTMLAPVAFLTVGIVLVTPRAARLRMGLRWLGVVVAAGGVWYLRNLLRTGSPLPPVRIGIGSLEFPHPPMPAAFPLVHYVDSSEQWRRWIIPPFHDAFGPARWVLLGLAALGLALHVIAGRDRMLRMLGVVGLLGCAAWAFSPRTGGSYSEFANLVGPALRYVAPEIALGLVLLPLAPQLSAVAQRWWLAGGLGTLVVLTLRSGPHQPFSARHLALALGIAGSFGLAALAVRFLRPSLAIAAAVILAAGAGWFAQRTYVDGRYAEGPLAWARTVHDARIGVAGGIGPYPLYGADLSNRVELVARMGPHGAMWPSANCPEWRDELHRGSYRYVVTSPRLIIGSGDKLFYGNYLGSHSPETAWTRSDPSAREIGGAEGEVAIFELIGSASQRGCD